MKVKSYGGWIMLRCKKFFQTGINFSGIYKFRLSSNHTKNINVFSTLCEIWNQKNDGWGRNVWLWVEKKVGGADFLFKIIICSCTN